MKKILILIILFLTGCTKYNDLAELTIIKSIGISYDSSYHVSAQIIDYIDDNNEAHMKVIKEKGQTLEKSFNNLQNLINQDIFFSHIDLLVLDNHLLDNNYNNIIQFFLNNNNFRNDFYCIFSPDVDKLLEKSQYDEIEIFIKSKKNIKIATKNLNEVISEYFDNEKIVLPNISYNNKISYLGNYEYNKGENNA